MPPPCPYRVVIVHHERPEAAAHTARAFVAQGAARVEVIDSGSEAAARARLGDLLADSSGVEIVDAGANVGFGPGCNIGLRRWLADAGGEPWVIVAPHDAAPEPGCADAVVAAAMARPRAALACAEYGPGEEVRPVVDRFFGGSFIPCPRGDGWESVDYAHGTLLAMRREALREIGLFDERFFAYCEEADLGIRARRAGWEVGLVWGAVVDNGRPPRADVGRYLQLRNTLLLLEKHFGVATVVPRLTWELGLLLAGRTGPTLGFLGAAGVPVDRAALRRASAQAMLDYLRRRFGPPPEHIVHPRGTPTPAA